MSIRAMPTLEPIATVPSLALFDDAIPSTLVQQEEVMERKKKRSVDKKVGWKVKSSKGDDLS